MSVGGYIFNMSNHCCCLLTALHAEPWSSLEVGQYTTFIIRGSTQGYLYILSLNPSIHTANQRFYDFIRIVTYFSDHTGPGLLFG